MTADRRARRSRQLAATPYRSARAIFPTGTLQHLRQEDHPHGDWGLTLFTDPKNIRGDVRLVHHAICAGWRCSRRKRKRIMDALFHLIQCKSSSPHASRLVLQIARVFLTADRRSLAALWALYDYLHAQEVAAQERKARARAG